MSNLELARLGDLDLLGRLAGLGANGLDSTNNVKSVDNLAEDNVLSVLMMDPIQ